MNGNFGWRKGEDRCGEGGTVIEVVVKTLTTIYLSLMAIGLGFVVGSAIVLGWLLCKLLMP